jgi:hypothetical protein
MDILNITVISNDSFELMLPGTFTTTIVDGSTLDSILDNLPPNTTPVYDEQFSDNWDEEFSNIFGDELALVL